MALLTYYDIVGKENFRKAVIDRLSENLAQEGRLPYEIPSTIPILYKYRSMSEYSVKDVVSSSLTFTSVEEFNDIFDSSVHTAYANETPSRRDQIDFSAAGSIGTYVFCMSEANTSNLMWAHYAGNSSGFCTGYDFNVFGSNTGARQILFPVTYTETPVISKDLMNDVVHELSDYPVDIAVLCAILNKSVEWSYEKEWRAVLIPNSDLKIRRGTLAGVIKPRSISMGYHFLKPIFFFPQDDSKIEEEAIQHLNNIKKLIKYCNDESIELSVMTPDIGSFSLSPRKIEPAKLFGFIEDITKKKPCRIQEYYIVRDRLERLLD